MRYFSLILLSLVLFSGCASMESRWRDDAFSRFNSAVSAGSQSFAPEETDNIRQTLKLADRYYHQRMIEDAERLYQLSCQKSQLLYRNLVLSKVRQGATLLVESGKDDGVPDEIAIALEPVSISEALRMEAEDDSRLSLSGSPDCDQTPLVEAVTEVPTSVTAKPVAVVPATAVASPPDKTAVLKSAEILTERLPALNSEKKTTRLHDSGRTPKSAAAKPSGNKGRPALVGPHDPGSKTIYLTFDDGPSHLTLPIASYLKSQGVAATFFVLGNNVKRYQNAIAATVAMGHRVGNHTLSHDLRKLNASFRQDVSEVGKTAALIEKLGGDGRMVRIPYGASTKSMISRVASEGGQIFDWDINSNDSAKRGAKDHAFIEKTVISQLNKTEKRHIILLFHDGAGHEATLVAIRNLIPGLKEKGYRFGLLSRRERVARTEQTQQHLP